MINHFPYLNRGGVEVGVKRQFLFRGILDEVEGAAFAVSTRVLSRAFLNEPIVRVRRSSDNTEQDFTEAGITGGALLAFTGAGDGFVTTLYDQSGNGRDAVQATAENQLLLVDGGVLVVDANGRANIKKQTGVAQFLDLPSRIAAGAAASVFSVYTATENSSWIIADATSGDVSVFGRRSTGTYLLRGTSTILAAGVHPNTVGIRTAIFNGANSSIRDNGTVVASGTTDAVLGFRQLLNFAGSTAGAIQGGDIIIYPSDQTANRAAIETNQAAHYGITLA